MIKLDIAKEDGVTGKPVVSKEKQFNDVMRIVEQTAHLSAAETGKAVLEYVKGSKE